MDQTAAANPLTPKMEANVCLQLARTRATAPRVQSASPLPEESAIVLALLDSTSTLMELAQT